MYICDLQPDLFTFKTVSDLNYIGTRAAAANIWNSGVDFLGVALKLSRENSSLLHSDALEHEQLALMFKKTAHMVSTYVTVLCVSDM